MLQNLILTVRKKSFRQVGLYTSTAAVTKIISFAALPFFVNTLSEGDIGILNIFSSTIVFLTPVVSMGVLYSYTVDYYKLPKNEYASIFSGGLLIPAFWSLLLIPVLYFAFPFLQNAFHFQPAFFWLLPACIFFNFCFEAFITLLRITNNLKYFSLVSLLKIVLEIGLSVALIVFVAKSWFSRSLGYFFSAFISGIIFFVYILKNKFLVRKISIKAVLGELSFGVSGLLLQMAIFFIGTSDKFFVMSFYGKEEAGFYAVAGTFATIQYIVCVSLVQYLQPILFRQFADGNTWKEVKPLYFKYIAVMMLSLVLLCIFTTTAYYYLLKASYHSRIIYFFILSASSFLWSVTNIFLQFIIFHKKKKIIISISLIAIITACAINYMAATYLTIYWLCAAQIVTNLFVLMLTLYFNKKLNFT